MGLELVCGPEQRGDLVSGSSWLPDPPAPREMSQGFWESRESPHSIHSLRVREDEHFGQVTGAGSGMERGHPDRLSPGLG